MSTKLCEASTPGALGAWWTMPTWRRETSEIERLRLGISAIRR